MSDLCSATISRPVSEPGSQAGAGDVVIADAPERDRYELFVDGAEAGKATYRRRGDRVTLIHTEVDPAYAGRGLGNRLARCVLDGIRARDLRIVPVCPFMRAYIRSHPDVADLVA
jgi:uncharacterized protein